MKLLFALVLVAILGFGAWPYYQVFRLDRALGSDDLSSLQPLVDLDAVRDAYKRQLDAGMQQFTGEPQPGSVLEWLHDNLRQAGAGAVEQTVTIEWVRDILRQATIRASHKPRPYFIGSISFAFFESWDRFLIRLGELGQRPTQIRLSLAGWRWRVSGIYQ